MKEKEEIKLSVVVCTYNPKWSVFSKVLAALRDQNMDKATWELVIVDNCSHKPLEDYIDLAWHPAAHIIREAKPGLSHARIAGVNESRSGLIVFADDDNVLENDYLEKSYRFAKEHPEVGCFGGRSVPVFETTPPSWFSKTGINLGCQDYGPELYVSAFSKTGFQIKTYPEKAPIGTGMVITKKAFMAYLNEAATNPERMKLGRRGKSLSSGEDNDILLTIIKKGYEIAYVPELVVHHFIPSVRYSKRYLQRMAFESNRTWIKVLEIHGMNKNAKISILSYFPRVMRSFFRHKPWASPLGCVNWNSSCGKFKGLSEI